MRHLMWRNRETETVQRYMWSNLMRCRRGRCRAGCLDVLGCWVQVHISQTVSNPDSQCGGSGSDQGQGAASGWVTAVSLCCFCNVALIFATMKTFILQQVKCCHFSPFLFPLMACRVFLPLNPFHWVIFLLSSHKFSSASLVTCFSFQKSPQISVPWSVIIW